MWWLPEENRQQNVLETDDYKYLWHYMKIISIKSNIY